MIRSLQDDKPYPPCGGHYNVAFDLSQDSTSSEKMDSEKGVSNQGFYEPERLSEQTRFGLLEKQSRGWAFCVHSAAFYCFSDKSNSGSVSARKTSLIRSLRKESKAKQPPVEFEMKLQSSVGSRPGTSVSNETLTTSCDYGMLPSVGICCMLMLKLAI
ncbi:hypothetical protein Y032_0075g934 [Ancylostoma ceylanicum]|uniref:Uncharacterized protein n=1 Tax=Ancylostoma ceylanicum TaxID=53326 RepID=A0A016TU10_9BILA|nr:hypothetical protein Y032_0075g934 [Ancylostoma ceylanicum]